MEDIDNTVKSIVEEMVEKINNIIVEPRATPPRGPPPRGPPPRGPPPRGPPLRGHLLRGPPPRAPPPRGPPGGIKKIPRRGENLEDELYLKHDDIADVIEINVPEKYLNGYEIALRGNVNLLINFLYQIKNIREQNFSLREVTLNRLMILYIQEKDREWECIDLFLNLGLNPYIDFNDYYIEELNCVNIKSPILVFKRYVRFEPYKIKDLYIKFPMTLTIMVRDVTEKGMEILRNQCNINIHSNKPKKVIKTCDFFLENVMNEKDIWTVEEQELYFKLSKKYEIDRTIIREKIDNLNIWKFGKDILMDNSNNIKEFDWFSKKMAYKKYDLVKIYEEITDFEKIMLEPIYDDDKEGEYYRSFVDIGYYYIRNKLVEKMKTLASTSICNENDYTYENKILKEKDNETNIISIWKEKNTPEHLKNKLIRKNKSKLTEILLNYIEDVQAYIFEGDDKKIRRYIKKEDLFDKIYENEEIYQDLLNENIFKIMEKGLEKYEEQIINNEQFELQTPDMYILLGFHEFPSKFKREYWKEYEFTNGYNWFWIVKLQSFLESTGWYYMYGFCCFFAQIIGPSYYLYNYYLIDKNEYCPNNSLTLNKCFAVAYYLVLYARMNSFWNSLTTTTWQYGHTTILTNNNYLRLTLIINSICLCIIPLFTYTLFIEMSSITDLILNCLTGEFLVNIDNLIIEFIGEEDFIKSITKDLLILSFIEKGFQKKNIMEGDTIELWIMSALQVIQMLGTLIMTVFVYKCI